MEEKLAALLRHLPALRAGGVTYVEVDGLKVLIDREPPAPDESGKSAAPDSPWNDPNTYGMPHGTPMPPSLSRRVGTP